MSRLVSTLVILVACAESNPPPPHPCLESCIAHADCASCRTSASSFASISA